MKRIQGSPGRSRNRRAGVLTAIFLCVALGAARGAEPSQADRYEPGVLPALAQDADVGFKFGIFTQLARFRDQRRPYAWRLQVLAALSVRDGATGTEFPYREAFVRLDRPHLWIEALRVLFNVGYLRTTNLGYYGVGNATAAEPLWRDLAEGSPAYVTARRFYQYDGTAPSAQVIARYRLLPGFMAMADLHVRWMSISVYQGSLLEQALASATGPGFPLGRGLQLRGTVGLILDTRNHETVPTRGFYNEASLRCGGETRDGNSYCALNLTLRGYFGLLGERLSLATRLLGDVAFGGLPLIELTRYGGVEGGSGPGGTRGIRGVPQGRLAGKSKLLANLEVRSFLLPFSIGNQRFCLGMVAFADVGRVWTDAFSASSKDGDFRLHWGVGGGPRVRWGDSLLIRADVSYAPLGAALGAAPAIYIDVDQVI